MKKKWYHQTWLLCSVFAFSIFIIPLICGIILGVGAYKEHKKIRQEELEKENNYKHEIQKLQENLKEIGADDIHSVNKKIEASKNQLETLDSLYSKKIGEIDRLSQNADNLKNQIIETEEVILLQSFGLYKSKYEFSKSELYKSKLEKIRLDQKEMIKADIAVTGNMNWTVNGSKPQGQKMVKDMQKLLLRAFNSECEEIIDRVKYNNFDASLKRITSSYEAISKLGSIMNVAISSHYYNSKIDELHLALDYQQKKQQEKEEQKIIREQLRENAKIQKEIEEQRRKIEKEQSHYESALAKISVQFDAATDAAHKAELSQKMFELESKLSDVGRALEDVDYRMANQKAGYVYVISNIGAFGENVYKIGMTRRLDPTERVDELGDASVPFDFDIHAMIFCDDAPALESALHRAFEDKKLNWVNTRREFFNVTLDEIKEVVCKHYDKTAEFIDLPDAEQYRISQKMKKEKTA